MVDDKIKAIQEANRVIKKGGTAGWLELSWKKEVTKVKNNSKRLEIKEKSKLFHSILEKIDKQKNYYLKLRKGTS